MKCIICGGCAFSMPAFAFDLPPNEQIKYTKYGDCCCMCCALEKVDIMMQKNGAKEIIIKGQEDTYTILIPNKDDIEEIEEEVEL